MTSAKYAIAILNKLITIFSPDLICGYDIGCGFSSTANNSPLLGPKVCEKQTHFCVGSFHAMCTASCANWTGTHCTLMELVSKILKNVSRSSQTLTRQQCALDTHRVSIINKHSHSISNGGTRISTRPLVRMHNNHNFALLHRPFSLTGCFLINNYCQATTTLPYFWSNLRPQSLASILTPICASSSGGSLKGVLP